MSRTKHDRDLVAGMQPHEVETVQTHFDISTKELREVIKEFGHSRERLYAILEEKGYKRREKPEANEAAEQS
jgi:transposase